MSREQKSGTVLFLILTALRLVCLDDLLDSDRLFPYFSQGVYLLLRE